MGAKWELAVRRQSVKMYCTVHGGKVGRCAWWKGGNMCMVERWEDVHSGKV